MMPIGLSSGCAPELDAADLAALTREHGGSVVDLRAGKDHAWEAGGIDALRAGGVDVCFVGISSVLGREDDADRPGPGAAHLREGVPVKVFAAAGCTAAPAAELTRRHVADLVDRVGRSVDVLVETHHGYADVDELEVLARTFGVSILLDTMGLARITDDPVGAAARLAPWTRFAQVKGFDPDQVSTSRHEALTGASSSLTRRLIAAAGGVEAITLETRSPTIADDLAAMRGWWGGQLSSHLHKEAGA